MKIAVIVGTRPEIIKLSATLKLLKKYSSLTLIHTGQNYDPNLSEVFFDDLKINKPDIYLDIDNSSPGAFVGEVIRKSYATLSQIMPDALLILGDTNSCMAAYSAKRLKIPIFHIEAGNRCFDLNVPEEINRKIIDHLSDVNFTYTKLAKDYLTREGLNPKYSIVAGSPMREILESNKQFINSSDILKKLSLKKDKYFLFSLHREENVDKAEILEFIAHTLDQIEKRYKLPIIFSMHPRTLNRIEKFGTNIRDTELLKIMKPFGFIDYCKLQTNATLVFSDSGTITEESSILKFRAISMRPTHERPEGEEVGALISTTFSDPNLIKCIDLILNQHPIEINEIADYGRTNFSSVIVKNIFSLTDLINKTVWLK